MRKETVDIDILVTSRNGDTKIMQSIRITEVEPVDPLQMNIYQSNTYRKDSGWLHFADELRVQVQERQQMKDQHRVWCEIIIIDEIVFLNF